ncbi:MAG TPA: hypothetical protein VGB50_07135 [Flavobacterium sp.]|jgi:hypothetical protein
MMVSKNDSLMVNVLTVLYFTVAMIEIAAELFYYEPLIYVFKPLMPLLLMAVYWLSSEKKQLLFFLAMLFSLLTNILFIPLSPQMLFFGIIAFMVHRIILIIFVFRLLQLRDYIPVAIGTVPFLLVFFYLLAISTEIPENSYVLLIIQNILISVLGGFALSNYMMNDDKRTSWLLICGLLFVALQFIVFLEKYYLTGISPGIFRPIAMGLNAFAFYTFYEFVLSIEKSDDDTASV